MGHENLDGGDVRDRLAEIFADYRRQPHTTGSITEEHYAIADDVIAMIRRASMGDAGPARPVITCLCGSGRFRAEFEEAEFRETLAGRIVLTIGCNTKDIARDVDWQHVKPTLDELHLRKIDLADEVLILSQQCYIGESTFNEIKYAQRLGKTIRWWEPAAEEVFNGMAQRDSAIGRDEIADSGGKQETNGLASHGGNEGEDSGETSRQGRREATKATKGEAGQERMEMDR